MQNFIAANRNEIVARTELRVATRTGAGSTGQGLPDGIPAFLNQLIVALTVAHHTDDIDHDEIRASAANHGRDLVGRGLSIEHVVHDYGDVCQVVAELAIEQDQPMGAADFRVFNLCLDDAIAAAITSFCKGGAADVAHAP